MALGMRILVLGAGALGGYYGGRALEAGAEVAFLVRPRRRAQLERDGLVVKSPHGDIARPVVTLEAAELRPGWDAVLLSCKAYDLDAAIEAIRPGVDGRTAILPVLNGMAHLAALDAAFGPARVLGGVARIQATLTPEGEVRHLGDWRWLIFGERDGTLSPRALAIRDAFDGPGCVAQAVPDIMARMWEKLVHLGTIAAGTVLMRANVGEIVRAGGAPFLLTLLERNAAIAEAAGHPVSATFRADYGKLFQDPASAYTASLLRDLESGGRVESEHILGFLLDAARRAGVPEELHMAALLHARAYEQRRDAGRLPRGPAA
jgi:2-dehydropantoate 2-reductase